MNKKEEELSILKKIYSFYNFYCEQTECPDFILKLKPDCSKKIGIEITRLFTHEGYARIEKIPNYIEDVISGKNIDKRDKGRFNIREIELISPQRDKQKVNAIIDSNKPIVNIEVLENCIEDKNKKMLKYDSNCISFNLIIDDHTDYFSRTNSSVYLTQNFIKTVIGSGFNEIFLLTKLKSNFIYVPLKLFIFNHWLSCSKRLFEIDKLFKDYAEKCNIITHMYLILKKHDDKNALLFEEEKTIKLKFSKYLFYKDGKKRNLQILPEINFFNHEPLNITDKLPESIKEKVINISLKATVPILKTHFICSKNKIVI
ncbi:hypothetical protein [Spirochaeta cellobiosiphila]|uniref:hypothetical protein n=1 Tax=Spirochaeta cellobiosiphila TaxID=504483 RepID=UPI000409C707|nr:hypothetical protein [Spirochaeta cellobiosiphila]